jgi:peptide/nickel transport system permease protein
MTGYLIRRSIQMVIVLALSSIAIYTLLSAAPGGPLSKFRLIADPKQKMSESDIENMQRLLGLHRPFQIRYVAWLVGDDWMGRLNPDWEGDSRGVVRFDFGRSWQQRRQVTVIMREALPNTLLLMTTSVVLAIVVAVPIGIYSAVHQYSRLDYVFTFFTFVGIALPAFWLGLMLILVFGNQFKEWGLPHLPTSGTVSVRAPKEGSLLWYLGATKGSAVDRAVHMLLPALVLSLRSMAGWMRFTRSSMLEVLHQDYVRTARAKGLAERAVLLKHAMRNALIPLVTIVTFEIPFIFGGAIIVEQVFGYPGMGRMYLSALSASDWPVVQAYLIVLAVLIVFATLLTDVLYTIVDPRIRFS